MTVPVEVRPFQSQFYPRCQQQAIRPRSTQQELKSFLCQGGEDAHSSLDEPLSTQATNFHFGPQRCRRVPLLESDRVRHGGKELDYEIVEVPESECFSEKEMEYDCFIVDDDIYRTNRKENTSFPNEKIKEELIFVLIKN